MQMEKRMFCVMAIICVHFDRWPMKIKLREMIGPLGGFFEVYVSTPIEICEQRDRKGLYAKARTFVRRGIRDMLTMFLPNGKTTRKPHPRTR